MNEERKRLIPIVSDQKVLDCIKGCDGSENSVLGVLKLILHLLADIRVFLRIIYKKLPKYTDEEILDRKG